MPLLVSAALPLVAGEESADYPYRPVGGGIEIRDGSRRFNRPLYSSVERPHRLIALVGDRPEFMLMRISGTKSMDKLTNLKLGLADGPWLDAVTPVLARYDMGVQHYRVGDPNADIEMDVVRGIASEGLLLRVQGNGTSPAPLVLAFGGRGSSNYDQNPKGSAFTTTGNTPSFADNVLTLSGRGPTVYATGSVSLDYTPSDPGAVSKGPKAMLGSSVEEGAVAALAATWPKNRELYFLLTTDAPDSESVKAFRSDPAAAFAAAVQDNREIASAIEIDTPDPYLNAALPSQLLGYNAAWNAPTIRHGAIAWHDAYAGWRIAYGSTVAGWHDRVQSHVQAFFKRQDGKSGRIPAMLRSDGIYNMGEELVDQALYDYEWSGDLEALRDGGFDAIARHLAWGEKYLKTPDGLYENFLNAWNTDYKWCNGGGGTVASTYYWRANTAMADIAVRLGKDPAVFKQRAEVIAAALKARLWSEPMGVYGEYRDRFGLQLLHASPDLPTISIAIDRGLADPFEAYRSLRFALRRFEKVTDLPRGGALIYSSEWLPNHYSTRDIYTAEVINMILALYQAGQAEAAEPLRRAIDGSCYSGPGPGSVGYIIHPDGTYKPHTDFTDTTSMYVRSVVEGLFGIRPNIPKGSLTLQPTFPKAWDRASIQAPIVQYRYSCDGTVETMAIKTPRELSKTVRLRARRAGIDKVTVNGNPADYSIEPGIGCAWVIVAVPAGTENLVQVVYRGEALPKAQFADTGTPGETLEVGVDRGQIKQIRQSRSVVPGATIAKDARSCTVPLPSETGVPTYFVLVAHEDTEVWLPVEVDVRPVPVKPAPLPDDLQPQTVDLATFRNQRLAELHKNTYTPRIEQFYWARRGDGLRTVRANGRSWWEGHSGHRPSTDTSALTKASGRFVTDSGIPFDVPASGKDSVFTTRYDNFPNRVEIPVQMKGRKICFLLAGSIPLMQTRMDNARITVKLDDGGERVLALRDPESIDDWLGSGKGKPYVQSGRPQMLGRNAHAVLQEMDFGEEKLIESVTLETRTEETMVGLLGITVMREEL